MIPERVPVLRSDGLSLQEMAQHLGVTSPTVTAYTKRIMQTMRGYGGGRRLRLLPHRWGTGRHRAGARSDE